jgi:hypothetical protein
MQKQTIDFILLKFNIKSRCAVSEIIVTLLLIAITIVAGVLIFSMFSGGGSVQNIGSSITQPPTSSGEIKIIGYDTRDGLDLSSLTAIDNTNSGYLVGGSEYIVLTLRYDGESQTNLNTITVNEVQHTWETCSSDPCSSLSSSFPSAGKFVIIPETNDDGTTPQTTATLLEGESGRVVVKLHADVGSLKLNKAIRLTIDASGLDLQKFIISAGTVR